MNYFWLNKHLSQWQSSIDSDHKPQAVIVSGVPGIGKHQLLDLILADLVCRESKHGHCGHCQNCHLLQQGHHPDVDRVEPEKNIIKVKMIRELTEFFTSTPHCSDYKVAVIDEAEKMNVAAANALLKVLEEPPSRGLLFLLSDTKHQLMPTIRSRCITLDVHLSQEEKNKLPTWLQQNTSQDEYAVNDALVLSDFQPLTAKYLLESDRLVAFKAHLDAFYQVLSEQLPITQAAKQLVDNQNDSDWALMQRYCLHLIKSQYNKKQHEVFVTHPLNQLIKKSPKVTHIIIKFNELIQQFMLNLNTQIKAQLLLESMLVEIKSAVNHGS